MAEIIKKTSTQDTQTITEDMTIASSASESDVIDTGDRDVVGFSTPASFTTSDITFEYGLTVGTLKELIDTDGSARTISAVAADKHSALNPALFLGARFIKMKTSNPQGAERVVKLFLRTLK